MIKKFLYLTVILFLAVTGQAQDIPAKPVPAKFVNDFANILTGDQAHVLESKLKAFSDTTTTQIVVVTINSLQGTTSNDFAQKLGQKWGVGSKENNNGLVLLIKPKTEDESGDCAIQVGYGLEEYVPDIVCHQIIYNVLIPAFKENDYYKGISNACDDIISLVSGKFTVDDYVNEEWTFEDTIHAILFFMVIGLFIFFAIIGRGGGGGGRSGGYSSGYHSYGGGGYSGGGGSSFGGGSFGGGGASGKW